MIKKYHVFNVYAGAFVFILQVLCLLGEVVCGYVNMFVSTIIPLFLQWIFFMFYVVWRVVLWFKGGKECPYKGIIVMLLPTIFVLLLVVWNIWIKSALTCQP